jgi:serralysin
VTTGEFGTWTPIGAVQVSGGYDVAWHDPSSGVYTVWSTDSSGNYLSNLIPAVPGNNTSLESLETTFNQDLNRDGHIGIPSATGPVATQSASVLSAPVIFNGTALTLDTPSTFTGQIIGFVGDGTSAGSDQIDLHGINYSSVRSSFDSPADTLTVADGTTTASLHFLGSYSQDNFLFANDGTGGTIILASTASSQSGMNTLAIGGSAPVAATITGPDTFVFAPNFGQITIANFLPASDTLQFSKAVFSNINAVLSATHDDASGNAVITDAAHDIITLQNVTTAQLLLHQSDFHFV